MGARFVLWTQKVSLEIFRNVFCVRVAHRYFAADGQQRVAAMNMSLFRRRLGNSIHFSRFLRTDTMAMWRRRYNGPTRAGHRQNVQESDICPGLEPKTPAVACWVHDRPLGRARPGFRCRHQHSARELSTDPRLPSRACHVSPVQGKRRVCLFPSL